LYSITVLVSWDENSKSEYLIYRRIMRKKRRSKMETRSIIGVPIERKILDCHS
jgi:hypothetical protein